MLSRGSGNQVNRGRKNAGRNERGGEERRVEGTAEKNPRFKRSMEDTRAGGEKKEEEVGRQAGGSWQRPSKKYGSSMHKTKSVGFSVCIG